MNNENLDEQYVRFLTELTNDEQDAIKVFSVMYMKSSDKIKDEKISSLEKSINGQIEFYGRKKKEYLQDIEQICSKYSEAIDKIISQYSTWFCATLSDLQETYNNQKVAITNARTSKEKNDELYYAACLNKFDNYEIVAQECKKQLRECKDNMESKLNELFYSRDKSLSVGKANIFQKIMNLFSGKTKVNQFVIESLNVEMKELENKVNNECENIKEYSIQKVAVIEDVIEQTQTIYNNIVKENVNYEQ